MQRRAADLLVELLDAAGVEVVFGLPGGTIAPLFDALLDRPHIRVVTMRHEGTAMFAAAGYARATGKLGVVMVTSGPGVLNCMTGLANADEEGLPVLLLAGEVPRKIQGRGGLQDGSAHKHNIVGMAQHATKLAVEIPDAGQAPTLVRRAIATALSGRRGPVLVTVPLDVSNAQAQRSQVSLEVRTQFSLDEEALDEAARLLAQPGHHVVFAGSGMRDAATAARLRQFVEHVQIPVMTTPKGKGVFPEDHPLSLGIHGLGGHPSAAEYVDGGIDVMLAVGTSLGDLATNGWSPKLEPRRALIHVDIDAARIGRGYAPRLAFAAPAEQFLDALGKRMRKAPPREALGVRYQNEASTAQANVANRIAPQRALWELQQVLPSDTIYTCDSGEHFLFAVHFIKTRTPDQFIVMSGLGSMGSGIGAAFGARLGRPDRTVAAICGDGGFSMLAAEVSTAAQEKLPLVIVVMNDGRLGMVENGNAAIFGRTPEYAIGPMDVARLAAALGAQTLRVENPGQILEHASRIRTATGPLVLDVRIDATVRLAKNGRFDALGGVRKAATRRRQPDEYPAKKPVPSHFFN